MDDRDDLERRLRDEGLAPGGWSNAPGDRYPAHQHGYDKVVVVVSGSIRFGLPDEADVIDLDAGDRLDLPASTRHDALVGALGVECLEAHVPAGRLGSRRRHPAGRW